MAEKPVLSGDSLQDPLQDFLGYQLRRLSILAMMDLSAALLKLEVNPGEASVLLVVAANPGAPQSATGRSLSIKSANMAPLAASLAQRKLIKRTRADGRSYNLTCTASGLVMVGRIRQAMLKHEERVFGTLSQKRRKRIVHELSDLRKALEQAWGES